MSFRAQKILSTALSLSNKAHTNTLWRNLQRTYHLNAQQNIQQKFIFQAQRTFFSKGKNSENQAEKESKEAPKEKQSQQAQQDTENTQKPQENQKPEKQEQAQKEEVKQTEKPQPKINFTNKSVEEILRFLQPLRKEEFKLPEGLLKEGGEQYTKEALNRLESIQKESKALEEKISRINKEYDILKKANEDVHKQMHELKERALAAIEEAAQTRKRIEKEKEQMKLYAVSELAKDVLETVDNLGRALESCKDRAGKGDNLYDGVVATEKILLKTLEKYGVVHVNPLKEKFDPNQHEALMQYDDPSIAGGHVGIVLQVGYKIADRILRPAKVGVVNERPDENQSKTQNGK